MAAAKFCALVLVAVFGVIATGCSTTPVKAPMSIGTQAHVQNATHTILVMGLNEAVFEKLSKAVAANDRMGVEQILTSGQFVELPSGTPVLVLGSNLMQGTTNVRVLSGNQAGKAGWVWTEDVVP